MISKSSYDSIPLPSDPVKPKVVKTVEPPTGPGVDALLSVYLERWDDRTRKMCDIHRDLNKNQRLHVQTVSSYLRQMANDMEIGGNENLKSNLMVAMYGIFGFIKKLWET